MGYFVEPHSHWPSESSREGPTHNLVRNSLKVHGSLESCNMIKGIACSIVRVQCKAFWTLGAKDVHWRKPWKENPFGGLDLSLGSSFLCFPSSQPWPFSYDPSPFPIVAPSWMWYPLIGFLVQHLSYLPDFGLDLQYTLHSVASSN